MNDRCYSASYHGHHRYRDSGIVVCEHWRRGNPEAFINFVSDMGDRPSRLHTLDRIDPFKSYSKENCRWADKTTQAQNQRRFQMPAPKANIEEEFINDFDQP
jgi:hypothetical protein